MFKYIKIKNTRIVLDSSNKYGIYIIKDDGNPARKYCIYLGLIQIEHYKWK